LSKNKISVPFYHITSLQNSNILQLEIYGDSVTHYCRLTHIEICCQRCHRYFFH